MTGNILSERTLYELGYLPEDIFREDMLYKAGKQKEYITHVNANKYPVFGSVGHENVVVMTKSTVRGNLNSGGKKNPQEKLKNECRRSQYITNGTVQCSCPRRSRKNTLPFNHVEKIIKEARGLQKKAGVWDTISQDGVKDAIRKIFQSSAFNTCTTQKLPVMSSQPMKIAVDEKKVVMPVNIQKPYNVPVHCKEAVHQQLLESVRMGIIEPVPVDDTSPCLLYTSPSPRDLSTSRMPSSA